MSPMPLQLETADTPARNGAGWERLTWVRPATPPPGAVPTSDSLRRALQEQVRAAREHLAELADRLEQLTIAAERAEADNLAAGRGEQASRAALHASLAGWLDDRRADFEAELAAARELAEARVVAAQQLAKVAERPAHHTQAARPWALAGLPAPFSAGSHLVGPAFS